MKNKKVHNFKAKKKTYILNIYLKLIWKQFSMLDA